MKKLLLALAATLLVAGGVVIGRVTESQAQPTSNDLVVFSGRDPTANSFKIFTVRTDGSELRQLTFGGSCDDYDPAWVPGGKEIVFGSNRTDNPNEYIPGPRWIMDADGRNQRMLTPQRGDSPSVIRMGGR
jgi:Tol biopolymer transport system component